MACYVAILLALVVFFSLACSSTESASISLIANTTYGPVRGEAIVLNTNKTLVRFLGVQFGHVKRFEAPESPTPWKTTRNATSFGKLCPQPPNVFVKSTNETDEQCLTINVYIPQDKAKFNALLPVMVWIYGGGYLIGGSGVGAYNGGYLATEGEVIVVTFNYRVGALGFLSTGTKEMPGNFGLLDQVKALHWVQDNIEK